MVRASQRFKIMESPASRGTALRSVHQTRAGRPLGLLGMLVSYMPLASFLRISTAKAGVGGEALMHAQMGLGAWN